MTAKARRSDPGLPCRWSCPGCGRDVARSVADPNDNGGMVTALDLPLDVAQAAEGWPATPWVQLGESDEGLPIIGLPRRLLEDRGRLHRRGPRGRTAELLGGGAATEDYRPIRAAAFETYCAGCRMRVTIDARPTPAAIVRG